MQPLSHRGSPEFVFEYYNQTGCVHTRHPPSAIREFHEMGRGMEPMKSSCMMLFPAIFLLFMTSSCGTIPDKARMDLERGNVPYYGDAFVRKSGEGDAEAVKLFLDAGMDPNATDKNGESALMAAAMMGPPAVAQLLLARGAQIERKDKAGKTPLIWAAWYGRAEAVELLLARGAKVDARDDKGHTAMCWTRKFQWKENRKKKREILRNAGAPPEGEGRKNK